jgi:hypothetical protein
LAASSHAFGNQRAFVLGHGTANLQQQWIMGVLTQGAIQKLNRTAALGEFIDQEHLMHKLAG